MGPVLGRDIVLFAKIGYFSGDLHGVLGGIETRDLSDSTDTVLGRLPELLATDTVGTNDAYPGYYDPSHHISDFMSPCKYAPAPGPR
jgi:hypothetical protein